MAYFRCGGGGIPSSIKTDMNAVLNKKFGTQGETYPPTEWADDVNLMGALPIRTASGTIAHFEDGADDVPMKSVVANIVPIQDLHGYANPWAGGAGSNKWDEQWELGGFNSVGEPIPADDRIRSVNFTPIQPNTSYYFKTTNTLGVRYYDANKGFISSATGTNTALTTPSNAYYLKLLILNTTTYENDVAVNYPSSVTTYSPYANVCPISGTSVLNVEQRGLNIFDKKPFSDWVTKRPYIVLNDNLPKNELLTMVFIDKDTSIDISGCYLGFVKDTYNGGTVQNEDYHWTLQNGTVRGRTDNVAEVGTGLCNYLMMYPTNEATYNKIFSRFDIMVVVGASTATDFEPYNAETYTFDLGQEIMGGTLDLVSGLLTINKVKEVRRWDSARNQGSSVGDYWRKSFRLENETIASTTDTECSDAPYYSAYSSNTLHYYIDSSAMLMMFLPNDTADSYEFEICYPLATPIEIHLTPEEINSYLGTNNLYVDSGEVLDVEYRADIDLLIAELEGNRGLQMMRATPTEENDEQEATENEGER